jgi:L-rhamnose-H+ transport protein
MSTASNYAIAVTLAVLAGFTNGSMNVFLRKNAPSLIRILSDEGWAWENSWFVFTVWTIALNAAFTLAIIKPDTLSLVYEQASAANLYGTIGFSLAWGVGTVGFGFGVRLLGVALGTSLLMSVVIIIGTLLPLIVFGDSDIVKIVVIVLGLVFAIGGFALGTIAGQKRDNTTALLELKGEVTRQEEASDNTATSVHSSDGVDANLAMPKARLSSKVSEFDKGNSPSFWTGVVLTTIAGVFAVMLQFAFVFGEDMISEAEDLGVHGIWAPLVIWYWAFMMGSIASIFYSFYLLVANNSFPRFFAQGFRGFVRATFLTGAMTAIWMSHIHLYGAASYLFGEDYGAALAW